MARRWRFARHRSHNKCALCGVKKDSGLVCATNQIVISAFKRHSILLARDARVCSHHVTRSGRVEDTIMSGLDGPFFKETAILSVRSSTKHHSTGENKTVKEVRKKPYQIRPHLLSFEDTNLTFSKGHLESLTVLQKNIKESTKSIHALKDTSHALEKELSSWKRMCEDLQDELLSLKDGGTFSIHGLKDNDAKIMCVLGIPSYQEFIQFVDELPLPCQQGTGFLDKYNQTAAGLLHLRTGATWLFLALLFYNSARKEKDLENAAIKILSFIEATMYFKYVHYPSFQEIMQRTSPSLLLDLPGCCAFIDGTYLYGESSYYGSLHRAMFCHYKNELQLTKFLVICDPTGYIMGVYGPTDASSDDKIFTNMIKTARDISEGQGGGDVPDLGRQKATALWTWIQSLPEEAAIGVDGGFPSAETVVPMKVYLPAKLRGEDSYSPQESIQSRELTKWRGVIERANRRLKVFRLLSVRFPNSSLINAELYFHVAAILVNRFGKALSELAEGEEVTFQKYFNE